MWAPRRAHIRAGGVVPGRAGWSCSPAKSLPDLIGNWIPESSYLKILNWVKIFFLRFNPITLPFVIESKGLLG